MSIILTGAAITVGGQAPPSRRGTSSAPPEERGDAYADYIFRAFPVLPCNHRHRWPVHSGKKEVTAAPTPISAAITSMHL